MNWLRTTMAAGLFAIWIPATSLCLMENVGWLTKNDGCCDDQSSAVLPCCALASAVYKMDDSVSPKVSPTYQVALLTDLAHLDQPAPQQFGPADESGVSPPELSTSWQFSFRAAQAPRAPSSAS